MRKILTTAMPDLAKDPDPSEGFESVQSLRTHWIVRILTALWFVVAVIAGLAIAFVAQLGEEARLNLGMLDRSETIRNALQAMAGFYLVALGPLGAWLIRRTRMWLILTIVFGALAGIATFLGIIGIVAAP